MGIQFSREVYSYPSFLGSTPRLSVERNSYSDVDGWLGGWLSVTAGIVSKRLNVSENFFDHLIAPS